MHDLGTIMEAFAYERGGDLEKAVDLNREIYDTSLKRDDKEMSLWAAGNIHLIYSRAGKKEEADRWLLAYCRIQNELAQIISGSTVKELDLRIAIDDYKDDLAALGEKERRGRILLAVGGVVALCVITVLALAVVYSRRRRKYIMTLYNKNLELLKVRRSLETAREVPPPEPGHDEVKRETASPEEGVASTTPQQPSAVKAEKELELEAKVKKALASRDVFNPDYQLSRLCAAVDSNSTYVARAVSAIYGKTFRTVVTELRIAEACRRLDNPEENRRFTIEAICGEVGFKSRAAFSVAFKNVTGLTPTEYRNAARRFTPPPDES